MRRRLVGIAGLAFSLVAGLAAYAYFVGTATLLEHAEALAFRRLSVSQMGEHGAFRLFFATHRTASEGSSAAPLADRYTAERGSALQFGSFDTHIEPTLGLGMMIDSSLWFLNEEIKLSNVQALGRKALIEQLRRQVEASPRRSLLVVVEAFHHLHDDPAMADADTEIANVVLTAPDVDHRELNERFRRELLARADNAAVYVSSNDRALPQTLELYAVEAAAGARYFVLTRGR